MGSINQNTAPAVWFYINYSINKDYSVPNGFSFYGISSRYTGTDAIKVTAYVD